ncbi:MAG: hypothetical protein FWE05_13650 [Defluviitaleaceae bacterium]|nr:hypothetical protein [Defluviitaleaceae bacterium]
MPKKYNISSKHDMVRLEKDLKNQAFNIARSKAASRNYTVDCPHCSKSVSITAGKSPCPFCRKEINLELNIKF